MPDEPLDIIDENDHELGFRKMKSLVHKDGDWHRGAHLWIVKDNKIMLQKRAACKDFFPNCLDISCAGHVAAGETFEQTIIREAEEELGLKIRESDLITIGKRKLISIIKSRNLISREVNKIFLYKMKEPLNSLKFQEDEVAGIELFTPEELVTEVKSHPERFTDGLDYFLEMAGRVGEILTV